MMKRDCEEFASLLSPFIDDELTPEVGARVADHLATCVTCGEQLEEMRRGRALIQLIPEAPAPAGLRAQVLARLAGGPARGQRAVQRRAFRPAVAFVAAATLIVALVAGWQWTRVVPSRHFSGAADTHGMPALPLEELSRQVGSPTAFQRLAANYQLREVDLEDALQKASFQVICPLSAHYDHAHLTELRACPLVHLSALRGENRVWVLQQPAALPVIYGVAPVESVTIAGQPCDRLRADGHEIIKWEHSNTRWIVVASAGNPEAEKVVSALVMSRS